MKIKYQTEYNEFSKNLLLNDNDDLKIMNQSNKNINKKLLINKELISGLQSATIICLIFIAWLIVILLSTNTNFVNDIFKYLFGFIIALFSIVLIIQLFFKKENILKSQLIMNNNQISNYINFNYDIFINKHQLDLLSMHYIEGEQSYPLLTKIESVDKNNQCININDDNIILSDFKSELSYDYVLNYIKQIKNQSDQRFKNNKSNNNQKDIFKKKRKRLHLKYQHKKRLID